MGTLNLSPDLDVQGIQGVSRVLTVKCIGSNLEKLKLFFFIIVTF